jgi:hypothetical protein
MFIGHFAPALIAATHPQAPRLGILFLGAQLVDIGFFTLMPLGMEAMRVTPGFSAMSPYDLFHMPFTHSLIGTLVWAIGFGMIVALVSQRLAPGVIAGAVVISHWFLDLLVHKPDLTLAGGPSKLGFGLWDMPIVAMPLEIALVSGAAWFFARQAGWTIPLAILLADMALFQGLNWFGPAPVSADLTVWFPALVAFGALTWLAWRVERPLMRRSRRSGKAH